jgi:hypothetical protein
MLSCTHSFAELELSPAAYDEIAGKLREAGYDHAFCENGTIDMHGLGITRPKPKTGVVPSPYRPHDCWTETGSAS